MTVLDKIVEYKKTVVSRDKKHMSELDFISDGFDTPRPFEQQIKQSSPAIIAEVKKASPSKGIICHDFNAVEIAKRYQDNNATCLSVLTDEEFFQGKNQYLIDIRQAVELPLLRKDFIIDDYQLFQSRHLGADCILLIVAILDDVQLHDYCQIATELGMAVLAESHTEKELKRAIQLPTDLIGINNRDLHQFKTSLSTTLELKDCVPETKTVITESGIHSKSDIEMMRNHGVNAFLIGEALMKEGGKDAANLF